MSDETTGQDQIDDDNLFADEGPRNNPKNTGPKPTNNGGLFDDGPIEGLGEEGGIGLPNHLFEDDGNRFCNLIFLEYKNKKVVNKLQEDEGFLHLICLNYRYETGL
jgi:hypothetical protein